MKAALFLAGAMAAAAPPQAWDPFPSRREVSPSGRHYLVLRPAKEGARFELVRRREGAPPLGPAREDPIGAAAGAVRTPVDRDPADAILASGGLPWQPLQARVLDGRPGAVLFERWGGVGGGTALALLGEDGGIRWRHALSDLFRPEAIAAFPREGGGVWWWQAWWVDEGRGVVVLAAAGDRFGEVALEDGKVRAAGASVLLTRVLEGPAEDRAAALEIAARLLPEGIAGPAREAASDERAPSEVRVRAALAAFRAGTGFRAGPILRDAAARGRPPSARSFAVRHLGEVLGEEALPILRDSLRGEADEAWRPALEALADLGEKVVPTLVAMLGEKDQSLDYRGGAAHVLGAIRSAKALPDLWEAALAFDPEGDEFHFVAGSALDAVVAVGPPDLRERLLGLLEKGTPHDARVADWLERNPGRDAVPALRKSLGRWGEFSWERRRLAAALKACEAAPAVESPR